MSNQSLMVDPLSYFLLFHWVLRNWLTKNMVYTVLSVGLLLLLYATKHCVSCGHAMGHHIDPSLSCFSFQTVLHDWNIAYKRTLAANFERVAHVAAIGFLSFYQNGSLPYVWCHIAIPVVVKRQEKSTAVTLATKRVIHQDIQISGSSPCDELIMWLVY